MTHIVERAAKVQLILALLLLTVHPIVLSQDLAPTAGRFHVETTALADGTQIDQITVNGPPAPPAGYERQAVDRSEMNLGTTVILPVPAYTWSFGAASTAGAMIAAYYDRMGYPYVYTGPTNYGVMPMDNSVWPDWVDSNGDTQHQCPLSATHNGLDGRTGNGHVDDYWDHYGQPGPDPWQGNWPEHPAGECTGDFMRTSQWVWPDANWNWDGATRFFFDGTGAPVHGTTLGGLGVPYTYDGGYGLKRFFETRGYPVSVMYNQYIQGAGVDPALGYTFADYMTAINTGYPVLLHLEGHTVVGVGYDSASHTVYLNDAWDHKSGAHSMTWGGSYAGMQHFGVTVVELPAPTAVKLVRFEAEPESAEIHVEWETASEIDNLGFNLYRAGAESGPWVRLNDAIIPSKAPGAVGGAVYAWLDDGVVPGVTYYYRLEAIDVYGTSTFHGPISATAASQRLRLPSRGMPRRMP